jgi:hypothetical protein
LQRKRHKETPSRGLDTLAQGLEIFKSKKHCFKFFSKEIKLNNFWFWLIIKKNKTMNNFLKESAKHRLFLEWQLMHQNPFSGF